MHPFSFTRRRHRRLIIIHRALRVSTAEQHQRREDETVSLSLSRPFFRFMPPQIELRFLQFNSICSLAPARLALRAEG